MLSLTVADRRLPPLAVRAAAEVLCLPIYPDLEDREIIRITEILRSILIHDTRKNPL